MKLALETISTCNRVCPTCLRNSYPNKQAVSFWFDHKLLPIDIIVEALDQFAAMDFHKKGKKDICLSHYNEPLMDARIAGIAIMAKSYRQFDCVYLNTNADFLTDEIAKSLDGVLDRIRISTRKDKFKSLFQETEVFFTEHEHIATHFSPEFNVKKLAKQHRGNLCNEPVKRIIINHRQQFLLCCDDIVGNFNLGTFPKTSLEDYWFGKKHTQIAANLAKPGGRNKYKYCSICPRV